MDDLRLTDLRLTSLTTPSLKLPSLKASIYTYNPNKNSPRQHVKDLGDVLLGGPGGTLQLRNTLQDFGFNDVKAIPILNKLIGAGALVWERTIEPLTRGALGEAGINTLETFGESMDILANPIKAFMPWAGGGSFDDFYKSLGWIDSEYRTRYQWNTGIFPVDFVGEIISDPTNWVSFGSKQIIKNTVDDIADTARKALTKLHSTLAQADDAVIQRVIDGARKNLDADALESLIKILEDNKATLKLQLENTSNLADKKMLKQLIADYDKVISNQSQLIDTIAEIRNAKWFNVYNNAMKAKESVDWINGALYLGANTIAPLNIAKEVLLYKGILPLGVSIYNKYVSRLKNVVSANNLTKVDAAEVRRLNRSMTADIRAGLINTLKLDPTKYDVDWDKLHDKFLDIYYDTGIAGQRNFEQAVEEFAQYIQDNNPFPAKNAVKQLKAESIMLGNIAAPDLDKGEIAELINKENANILERVLSDPDLQNLATVTITEAAFDLELQSKVAESIRDMIEKDFARLNKTVPSEATRPILEHWYKRKDEILAEINHITGEVDIKNKIEALTEEIMEYDSARRAGKVDAWDEMINDNLAEIADLRSQLRNKRLTQAQRTQVRNLNAQLNYVNKNIATLDYPDIVFKLKDFQNYLGLDDMRKLPAYLEQLTQTGNKELAYRINTVLDFYGITNDNIVPVFQLLDKLVNGEYDPRYKSHIKQLTTLLQNARAGADNLQPKVFESTLFKSKLRDAFKLDVDQIERDIRRNARTATHVVDSKIGIDDMLWLGEQLFNSGTVYPSGTQSQILQDTIKALNNGNPDYAGTFANLGDVLTEYIQVCYNIEDLSNMTHDDVLLLYESFSKVKSRVNDLYLHAFRKKDITDPKVLEFASDLYNLIQPVATEVHNDFMNMAYDALLNRESAYRLTTRGVDRYDIVTSNITSYLEDYLEEIADTRSQTRRILNHIQTVTKNKPEYAILNEDLNKLFAVIDNSTNLNLTLNQIIEYAPIYLNDGTRLNLTPNLANWVYNLLYDRLTGSTRADFNNMKTWMENNVQRSLSNAYKYDPMDKLKSLIAKDMDITNVDLETTYDNILSVIHNEVNMFIKMVDHIDVRTGIKGFVGPALNYNNILTNDSLIAILNRLGSSDDIFTDAIRLAQSPDAGYALIEQSLMAKFIQHVTPKHYKRAYNEAMQRLEQLTVLDKTSKEYMAAYNAIIYEELNAVFDNGERNTLAEALVNAFNDIGDLNAVRSGWTDAEKKYHKAKTQRTLNVNGEDVTYFSKAHERPIIEYYLASDIEKAVSDLAIGTNMAEYSRELGFAVAKEIEYNELLEGALNPNKFALDRNTLSDVNLYERIYKKFNEMYDRIQNIPFKDSSHLKQTSDFFSQKLTYFFRNYAPNILSDPATYFTDMPLDQLNAWHRTIMAGALGDNLQRQYVDFINNGNFQDLYDKLMAEKYPDKMLEEQSIVTRITNSEMRNLNHAWDTLDDPSATLEQKQQAISDCLPSTYPGLLNEWWIQETSKGVKDPASLNNYSREFQALLQNNGFEYERLKAPLNKIALDDRKVFDIIKDDNTKAYLKATYYIDENTTLNSHKFGKFLADEHNTIIVII